VEQQAAKIGSSAGWNRSPSETLTSDHSLKRGLMEGPAKKEVLFSSPSLRIPFFAELQRNVYETSRVT
jgi:hypothetical protein